MPPLKESLTADERELLVGVMVTRQSRPLDKALEGTGISRATYYRWAENFPDEFAELAARASALVVQERELAVFDEEGEDKEIRQRATDVVRNSLESLDIIVRRQPYEILDRAGNPKQVYPYPRDVIAAARAAWEIAQGGILPQKPAQLPPVEEPEEEEGLTYAFPANVDFSKADISSIRVETKDGASLEVNAPSSDVVEGKYTDLSDTDSQAPGDTNRRDDDE